MGYFINSIQQVKDASFGIKRQPSKQGSIISESPKDEQAAADGDYNERQPLKAYDLQNLTIEPQAVQILGSKYRILIQNKTQSSKLPPIPIREIHTPKLQPPEDTNYKKRDPYFVQIGFDFGTSFSKCICRDVMIDKSWVYIPPEFNGKELPFLIPSCLKINNGTIHLVKDAECQYPENGLYYLKLALEVVAMGHWEDRVLDPYRNAIGQSDPAAIKEFIKGCGVYFLAETFSQVRKQIHQKYPNFGSHEKDYMAINIPVPVADAQRLKVNIIFQEILNQAWLVADELAGYDRIAIAELKDILNMQPIQSNLYRKEDCYIYPEVSANVQGFVRSRVSSTGIYLFSDVGAGSVDQSIFIFFGRKQGEEHLTYLHGIVLPLGSSHIERLAAEACGNVDCRSLESWKEKKEDGGQDSELRYARHKVAEDLVHKTETALAWAKKKLIVKQQLNDIRVIFAGGGHCKDPYEKGVLKPFSGQLFPKSIEPPVMGLPIPTDLKLKPHQVKWMRRLSVAYGLSFERNQLTGFTYPKDVEPPIADKL